MNTSKQQILDLGVEIYRLTAKLSPEEEHVLKEMLMRATGDLAANIAMSDVDSSEERAQFLSTAGGKIAVIETMLQICVAVKYLEAAEIATALNMCAEIEGTIGRKN